MRGGLIGNVTTKNIYGNVVTKRPLQRPFPAIFLHFVKDAALKGIFRYFQRWKCHHKKYIWECGDDQPIERDHSGSFGIRKEGDVSGKAEWPHFSLSAV